MLCPDCTVLGFQGTALFFCEEPVPAELTQKSHCATLTALIDAAATQTAQELPSFAPNTAQLSFQSQKPGKHSGFYSYLSGKSCSSLFCSLGKSTQPLNLSSHRFKEHQPNNPQLFGKAGCFQHQLPQGTTPHKLWQATNHNPILPQPDRAGTPRGMEGSMELIIPMSDPKAAVGGAAGGLGRQIPSVIFGLVCCQRGVLRQQPPIGARAGRVDLSLSQWERCLLHFPASTHFSPRASTSAT